MASWKYSLPSGGHSPISPISPVLFIHIFAIADTLAVTIVKYSESRDGQDSVSLSLPSVSQQHRYRSHHVTRSWHRSEPTSYTDTEPSKNPARDVCIKDLGLSLRRSKRKEPTRTRSPHYSISSQGMPSPAKYARGFHAQSASSFLCGFGSIFSSR